MMKKITACMLAALWLLAVLASASAEVFVNVQPPDDWYERDLFRLIAVDVNRSDAMILICGGEAMMVDGGSGGFQDRFDAVAETYGITAFKYLFNTHSDNDHIVGLTELMQSGKYEVGMFTSPNRESYTNTRFHQPAVRAANRQGIEYHVVEDGEVLTLGGASMTVMRCMESWGANARSATLMITFGESRIFLTGDLDNRTMTHYLKKYGAEALDADIMKAPHHGISTIPVNFLEAVSPDVFFVPSTSKRAANITSMKNFRRNAPDTVVLYSGDGNILMETDGVDWFIWQDLGN